MLPAIQNSFIPRKNIAFGNAEIINLAERRKAKEPLVEIKPVNPFLEIQKELLDIRGSLGEMRDSLISESKMIKQTNKQKYWGEFIIKQFSRLKNGLNRL